jgi:hypothetical protein
MEFSMYAMDPCTHFAEIQYGKLHVIFISSLQFLSKFRKNNVSNFLCCIMEYTFSNLVLYILRHMRNAGILAAFYSVVCDLQLS